MKRNEIWLVFPFLMGSIAISKFIFQLGLRETDYIYLFGGFFLILLGYIIYDTEKKEIIRNDV